MAKAEEAATGNNSADTHWPGRFEERRSWNHPGEDKHLSSTTDDSGSPEILCRARFILAVSQLRIRN
jgi:hypothetical protein